MAEATKFKKVIVNHNGYCGGYNYIAGEPTKLPEDVLKALSPDDYKIVDGKADEEQKQPSTPVQEKKEDSDKKEEANKNDDQSKK